MGHYRTRKLIMRDATECVCIAYIIYHISLKRYSATKLVWKWLWITCISINKLIKNKIKKTHKKCTVMEFDLAAFVAVGKQFIHYTTNSPWYWVVHTCITFMMMTFRWWADDGPLLVVFGSYPVSSTKKKNVVRVGLPLTKLSGSAHE